MKGRAEGERCPLVITERSRNFDQETSTGGGGSFDISSNHRIIGVIIRAPRNIPFRDGFLFLIVVTSLDFFPLFIHFILIFPVPPLTFSFWLPPRGR